MIVIPYLPFLDNLMRVAYLVCLYGRWKFRGSLFLSVYFAILGHCARYFLEWMEWDHMVKRGWFYVGS